MKHRTRLTDKQIARLEQLRADPNAWIGYWCSNQWGLSANRGDTDERWRATPGKVQEIDDDLELVVCPKRKREGGLHATRHPHRWSGCRVWLVALFGERVGYEDKCVARKREIICELRPGDLLTPQVAVRLNHHLNHLCGADLQRADLRGEHLQGAKLKRANLKRAKLQYSNLYLAKMQDVNLQYARLRRSVLRRADLRGADLRTADLRSVDFRCSNLRRVNFQHANFNGSDLRGANLWGANLQNTDLRDVNLRDTDLRSADLRYAALSRANLRGAKLLGSLLPEGYEEIAIT